MSADVTLLVAWVLGAASLAFQDPTRKALLLIGVVVPIGYYLARMTIFFGLHSPVPLLVGSALLAVEGVLLWYACKARAGFCKTILTTLAMVISVLAGGSALGWNL